MFDWSSFNTLSLFEKNDWVFNAQLEMIFTNSILNQFCHRFMKLCLVLFLILLLQHSSNKSRVEQIRTIDERSNSSNFVMTLLPYYFFFKYPNSSCAVVMGCIFDICIVCIVCIYQLLILHVCVNYSCDCTYLKKWRTHH